MSWADKDLHAHLVSEVIINRRVDVPVIVVELEPFVELIHLFGRDPHVLQLTARERRIVHELYSLGYVY